MTERNRGIALADKEQRHYEAQDRNAAWRAMTPSEQLLDLDAREMTATKQRARIAKGMK